jgi:sugar phosphate permease
MPSLESASQTGRYRIVILLIVWILYVINYFDKMAVLYLLPAIRTELKLSHEVVGFADSLFFLAYTVAQLPAGMLADKFGPKKVMYFAITVFTFFTFFTGMVKSLTAFVLVRLGLGFGEGFHFVPSIRAISDWFPPKEKGRATSFFTTSWTVAPAIGAIMITAIAATWGWRSVFYVLCVPGIIGIIALWYYMKDTPEQALQAGRLSQAEFDYIKTSMAAAAPGAKSKATTGYKEISKDPQLWIISMIVFFKTFVYWGAATWLSSFLVEQHGFRLAQMGLLASLPFFVGFVGQMSSGWMMDKVTKSKARPLIAASFAALAVVLGTITLIPKGSTGLLILALIFQGFFIVFWDGPIYAFVQMRYPKHLVGTVTGVTQAVGQFGSFVAPTVAGFLVVAGVAGSANFTKVFLLFMAISIGGAVLAMFMDERRLEESDTSTMAIRAGI